MIIYGDSFDTYSMMKIDSINLIFNNFLMDFIENSFKDISFRVFLKMEELFEAFISVRIHDEFNIRRLMVRSVSMDNNLRFGFFRS